jgi:rhamnulokinase
VVHIIGEGSRNALLNQFTADATGCTVVAGPVEATALGNILLQAIAVGQIGSLTEARALVRQSFETLTYPPQAQAKWEAAYTRYMHLRKEG